jgi:DNA-binding NarL/FixJ family response regulator
VTIPQPLLKILVADDHALVRDGLVLMIQRHWVEAQCDTASDYINVISQLDAAALATRYSAIILDLRMPGMRGVESVAKIVEYAVSAPVIVCTALEDPGLVERLMKTGVRSVVNKTKGADELLLHLQNALDPKNATNEKAKPGALASRNSQGAHEGSAMLTRRQREILKLLHLGKPSKVIASELNVSLDTIKSHLSALYAVMGVTSRAEAIIKSQEWFL